MGKNDVPFVMYKDSLSRIVVEAPGLNSANHEVGRVTYGANMEDVFEKMKDLAADFAVAQSNGEFRYANGVLSRTYKKTTVHQSEGDKIGRIYEKSNMTAKDQKQFEQYLQRSHDP